MLMVTGPHGSRATPDNSPGRVRRHSVPTALLRKLQRFGQPPAAKGKRRRRARRYIPPEIGLERFFSTLGDRRTRYVVLRWFDELPEIKPGGDVDLLIDDRDVDSISDLFTGEMRGTACDLFSVSGLRGTSYRGIPYLPPDKAAEVLARAVMFRDLLRVPSPEDYFLSLAYHAVYQKGLRSGLPTSAPGLHPDTEPRHDYAGDLGRLAAAVGIDVPIRMEELDEYLAGRGWRPPPAMRVELGKRNPWVRARFPAGQP
jgi:hypothetical protein